MHFHSASHSTKDPPTPATSPARIDCGVASTAILSAPAVPQPRATTPASAPESRVAHPTHEAIHVSLFGELGTRKELENKAKAEGHLPPGQSLTLKWPVLHYGSIPTFNPDVWDFKISGQVEEPKRLTWNEFRALPQTETMSDFHCVTRWSRLDNRWKGVLFTDVLKLVQPKPEAQFALILAEEGYTANVPLADLTRPDVLFAFEHDGQPLAAEHGGPLRLIVPQLYAWKSVKWVRGFMLLDHDRLGFWERNGYHAYGDPWKEQRYSGR